MEDLFLLIYSEDREFPLEKRDGVIPGRTCVRVLQVLQTLVVL